MGLIFSRKDRAQDVQPLNLPTDTDGITGMPMSDGADLRDATEDRVDGAVITDGEDIVDKE
ncbi:MAG: hypothetical protein K2K37_09995, partial [Muribaculaceae bacterium]|nr:hypothetical protein [Muribaculaceae bacterium]